MPPRELSRAEEIAALTPEQRREVLANLPVKVAEQILYDWEGFWSRPSQRTPPGDWRVWLVLAGRGFGKTRTGAEFVRGEVQAGRAKRVALAGPTAADVRDTMLMGESGLLNLGPEDERPKYLSSLRRLEWPNGAIALLFSADEPDRFRGPQHDLAWGDEIMAWRRPDAWDQLMFGLRLGTNPRAVVTTTPRPTPLLKALMKDPTTHVTRGSTYDNRANLAPAFLDQIVKKYEGTRLGRQELNAEILDDTPGALWTRGMIEALRVQQHPDLKRIVVAVDPSVAAEGEGDECGIVVVGIGPCTCKGGKTEDHGFVLDDLSAHLSPNDWAQRVAETYRTQKADRIIAEANQGGALVTVNLQTVNRTLPVKLVHASQGKRTRAEPVAALYEQKKIHHVGAFPRLEDELCTWTPLSGEKSPNRLDALVWGLTELMLNSGEAPKIVRPAQPIRLGNSW